MNPNPYESTDEIRDSQPRIGDTPSHLSFSRRQHANRSRWYSGLILIVAAGAAINFAQVLYVETEMLSLVALLDGFAIIAFVAGLILLFNSCVQPRTRYRQPTSHHPDNLENQFVSDAVPESTNDEPTI